MACTKSEAEHSVKKSFKSDRQVCPELSALWFFCKEKIILLNMAKGCRPILLMLGAIMVAVVTQQGAAALARVPIHLFQFSFTKR